jgi:hypothetical protein
VRPTWYGRLHTSIIPALQIAATGVEAPSEREEDTSVPIQGLSEIRRMPRIGKLRLGVKETSSRTGKQYPKAVDYFVVKEDLSTSAEAAEEFKKVYGDKPRSVDIMFPTDNPEEFFPQFYRRYGSGAGLLCKGDGRIANMVAENGQLLEVECCPESCEWAMKKHCRPVGTIQFLIPSVPGVGCWQIDTSSYHSVVNLNSGIEFIRQLTGGRIAGIPLRLVVKPKEVQVDGKKKVVYVLDLACEKLRLQDVLEASRQTLAQLILPPPDMDEIPDDLYPADLVEASQAATRAADEPAIDAEFSMDPSDVDLDNIDFTDEDLPDARDEEIETLFDALQFTPARRTAYLAKHKDRDKLIAVLRAEAERQAEPAEGAKQNARPTQQARPAQTAPRTQARAAASQAAPQKLF